MGSSHSLRYTTFAPGELDAEIRRVALLKQGSDELASSRDGAQTTIIPITRPSGRGGRLIKAHSVAVPYPDGAVGPCLYERLGPAYHRFDYQYADGAHLHRAYVTGPFENAIGAIERAATEGAAEAFREAVATERKDRFCRITEPADGSRKKNESRYQMGVKSAQYRAGMYAVCMAMGNQRLFPVSRLFDTIEEANDAWTGIGNADYEVACCNRLDRCWDVPKYNPMPGRGASHHG